MDSPGKAMLEWGVALGLVLCVCGVVFADEAAPAAVAASGILATGFLGGLWKGIAAGAGRALVGFFDNATGTKFEFPKFLAAVLAGAIAGAAMGTCNVPFDTATGWLATAGVTELIFKGVAGLWKRWGGDVVARAVARAGVKPPGV